MLILFFDSKGVIHHEYVFEDQTVNATFYVHVSDRLCKRIARVRLVMWGDRKFFLLHDNACPHTAAIVRQFLAKKGMAQLSHPLYWPDLSTPSPSQCASAHCSDCSAVFGQKRDGTVESPSILARFKHPFPFPHRLFRFLKIKIGAER